MKLILESAKSSHPKEFLWYLRGKGNFIYGLIIPPGSLFGERSVVVMFGGGLVPSYRDIIGTAHSHPSGVLYPSEEDLFMFSKFGGKVHIIVGFPYEEGCWRAYDPDGNPIKLEIIEDLEGQEEI